MMNMFWAIFLPVAIISVLFVLLVKKIERHESEKKNLPVQQGPR